MIKVNTIDKCHNYLDRLHTNGWRLWQMQYNWSDNEGFHAWFWKTGEEDVELVTHSKDVQDAIMAYK